MRAVQIDSILISPFLMYHRQIHQNGDFYLADIGLYTPNKV